MTTLADALAGVALGQDARIGSAVVLVATRRVRVLGGCAPAPRHTDPGRGGGMPPEQENFNRQIEALQRYVSDLQRQRERAKVAAAQPAAAEPPGRPSRRWLLLTGLLVVLAMVGGVLVGAVAWSDDRSATTRAGASPATPSTAAATVARSRPPRVRRRWTGPTRCSPAP